MRTIYEWAIETVDEGEIVDTQQSEKLSDFTVDVVVSAVARKGAQLVLVCDIFDSVDDLDDRFWAYVESGKLPEKFGDSERRVPARFHKELAREIVRTSAAAGASSGCAS